MRYLDAEEVLLIHAAIIEATGGSQGMRDVGLFASILAKPQMQFGGKELYPGVFLKAAVYLEGIARTHAFVDGNKRTGFAAAARFLFDNGYHLLAENNEVVSFMVAAVTEKFSEKDIATWLQKNSKKIK